MAFYWDKKADESRRASEEACNEGERSFQRELFKYFMRCELNWVSACQDQGRWKITGNMLFFVAIEGCSFFVNFKNKIKSLWQNNKSIIRRWLGKSRGWFENSWKTQ